MDNEDVLTLKQLSCGKFHRLIFLVRYNNISFLQNKNYTLASYSYIFCIFRIKGNISAHKGRKVNDLFTCSSQMPKQWLKPWVSRIFTKIKPRMFLNVFKILPGNSLKIVMHFCMFVIYTCIKTYLNLSFKLKIQITSVHSSFKNILNLFFFLLKTIFWKKEKRTFFLYFQCFLTILDTRFLLE